MTSVRLLLCVLDAGPLGGLIQLWNAYQVELQGRYSLSRLHELQQHAQTSSRARNLVTVLLSPLPCLFVVTAMDMLPLNSPQLGFLHQTAWITFRVAFAGWIMAYMITMQIHHSSPTLPLSPARLWMVALAVSMTVTVIFTLMATFVAFPTPFTIPILTPPWFVALSTSLYFSWRHALRRDTVARENLRRYSVVVVAQVSIFLVYTAYNVTFTTVGRKYETYVALILPSMKLFFKNVVNHGVYHMEDLAPTVIVFNVDVFHALFVSSTMQQAKTRGSVIFIMAVDAVQAVIALVEVQTVMRRIYRHVSEIDRANKAETKRLQTLGLIGYAQHILNKYARVREHHQLTHARHLRGPYRRYAIVPLTPNAKRAQNTHGSSSVNQVKVLTGPRAVPAVTTVTTDNTTVPPPSHELSRLELTRVRIVYDILKLLHMVEFYVLIEFAEVVIAAVYGTLSIIHPSGHVALAILKHILAHDDVLGLLTALYLLALSFLPIRQYYKPVATLSSAEMHTAITHVAQYASLELLSFVLFCIILDHVLAWRISTVSQLAFVLRKHARIMQTTLVMWVFFVSELTLEHLGSDYTFQFKWLRERNGMA